MNASSVTLAAINLAAIGALPRLFFRRDGRLNARWWLTASPFFLAGIVGAAAVAGVIDAPGGYETPRAIAAAVLHASSIALIAMTVGSHRIPLALWHQDNDAPQELVTWGPYRLVRHPFYIAFIVCLAGCLTTLPHFSVAVIAAYAVVALDVTARREERRLLESSFGDAYREYMARTGRLIPLVGRSPG